jgi:hypothetical protein
MRRRAGHLFQAAREWRRGGDPHSRACLGLTHNRQLAAARRQRDQILVAVEVYGDIGLARRTMSTPRVIFSAPCATRPKVPRTM